MPRSAYAIRTVGTTAERSGPEQNAWARWPKRTHVQALGPDGDLRVSAERFCWLSVAGVHGCPRVAAVDGGVPQRDGPPGGSAVVIPSLAMTCDYWPRARASCRFAQRHMTETRRRCHRRARRRASRWRRSSSSFSFADSTTWKASRHSSACDAFVRTAGWIQSARRRTPESAAWHARRRGSRRMPRHHRDQPGVRHEIRVIERCARLCGNRTH
jgi:hypothetical protein